MKDVNKNTKRLTSGNKKTTESLLTLPPLKKKRK